MQLSLRLRLSLMMFLQFFIWGAWYVTAPNYLGTIGFGAGDFAWTYSVGPIAGMLSPVLVGILADRFFPAQRVLGLLHILGGIVMLAAAQAMASGMAPAGINSIFFGYMLAYYPTLALTNTIALRNMPDPEKQFPAVRVLGTIGWITAGVTLSVLGWGTKIDMFQMAAKMGSVPHIFTNHFAANDFAFILRGFTASCEIGFPIRVHLLAFAARLSSLALSRSSRYKKYSCLTQ